MKKNNTNNNGHRIGWLAEKAKSLANTLWLTSEWPIDRRLPERLDVTKPPFASANKLVSKTNGEATKAIVRNIRMEWPDDDETRRAVVQFFSSLLTSERPFDETFEVYWFYAKRELVRNTVLLLLFAGETISTKNINRVIESIPTDNQVRDANFAASSYCVTLLDRCCGNQSLDADRCFEVIGDYFMRELPSLHERTRNTILASLPWERD